MKIKVLPGRILASSMKKGERKIGSIIIMNDDQKTSGIRPRWLQVWQVGAEVTDVEVGDWVLVEHGRWSRKMDVNLDSEDETVEVWAIEPKGIIMKSKENPVDEMVKE